MEINEDEDSHKKMMQQIKEKAKMADAKDKEKKAENKDKKTEEKYKDIKMSMKDGKENEIKDEVDEGKKGSHDK